MRPSVLREEKQIGQPRQEEDMDNCLREIKFCITWDFPGGTVVKNLPANAGDTRDLGLIPRSQRSPGEGNGTPLKYSCWGNSMDIRAWQASVHGVPKNQTQLSDSTQACRLHHIIWKPKSSNTKDLSVPFSCSVVSNSLPPRESQHARPHQLPEFTQTHVHQVGDAIQPSHPLSSLSPPATNPSQHQGLFQ